MAPGDVLRRAVRSRAGAAVRARVPTSLIDRAGRTVFSMGEAHAAAIAVSLREASVDALVAGGWGIEALAPRRRRRHFDLDLLVEDPEPTTEALGVLGFSVAVEHSPGGWWAPDITVLRGPGGRVIELLGTNADLRSELCRRGAELLGRPVDRFDADGSLDGHPVRCLSIGIQLAAHDGYELTRAHRADVRWLEKLARG